MKHAVWISLLLLLTTLAGCLGDDDLDYSNFDGCTGDEVDEECTTELPGENNTTNGTEEDIGTYENQTLPLIESIARDLNGTWQNWSSADLFSENDSWVLIQFAATDCGHCWNGAELMSDLHSAHRYNVTFLTFIINFSWSNSSLEEIAAFQDESNFDGCNNDNNNCNERPGDPHNWTYVDDRNLTWLFDFHMTGTPSYVLIQPDGVVGWHQQQRDEGISDALERLFPTGA